ncbi:MAG: helix-turn-helix domain-containing protein [Candidatus Korarchaeota archaeon]|nr:helix-turn-helix domain-containing protein [Candidatus Korarchaeota archaeon]
MGSGNLQDLLSVLSSEDRLRILSHLSRGRCRLSELARAMGISVQEAHKHLSKMVDRGLVLKDDGYELSCYGRLVLAVLPSLKFLADNSSYFATRKIPPIPDEFFRRIGELEGSVFTDDVMYAFREVELSLEEAEKYIWIASTQVLMSSLPRIKWSLKKGAEFKVILPVDLTPPRGFKPLLVGDVELRAMEEVPLILILTERDCFLSLPRRDGRFDYSGFKIGRGGHRWCEDLFSFLWENSTPLSSLRRVLTE